MTGAGASGAAISEAALPDALRRFLDGAESLGRGGGGSGALVLRCARDGNDTFVKYVPDRADAVDGHRPGDLEAKAGQVRLIHAVAPALRSAVPAVEVSRLDSGTVLTSPYVEGTTAMALLLAGETERFAKLLVALLDLVGDDGYSLRQSPADRPSAPYGERARRRLDYLATHLGDVGPRASAGSALGELDAIADLTERVALERDLLPATLYFPVHGDLNLFNVILALDGTLVMVDQRGVVDDWDPVYDLGKMLLSLGIQGGLETGRYRVLAGPGGAPGARVVASPGDLRLLRGGAEAFRHAVDGWPFAAQLESDADARWARVLYAAAVHAVAEAACRVSVARSGFGGDSNREVAKAHAYLAFARRLLEDLLTHDTPGLPWPEAVAR